MRYALAVVGGYLSFLSFVRVWIAYQTRNWAFGRAKPEPSEKRGLDGDLPDALDMVGKLDVPDLSVLNELGNLGSAAGNAFSGGGGGFGGGGASGSFDVDLGSGDSSSSGALDAVSGSDDALPIVIAVIALLGGVVALGFVVYSSPVLFAEVLLDVAVLGAVYKRISATNAVIGRRVCSGARQADVGVAGVGVDFRLCDAEHGAPRDDPGCGARGVG